MWLYSHLVVAEAVRPYLRIDDLDAYCLGATVPDIRHWVDMRRAQTHIPAEEVAVYLARYPHLRSFVLGYLVHILSEDCTARLGLDEAILRRFPLCLVRRRLPARFMTVLFEWYCYETVSRSYHVSSKGNEMLSDLGIDSTAIAAFAQDVNEFLRDPGPEKMLNMLEDAVGDHPRYEQYARFPRLFDRFPLLRQLVFALSRGPVETFNGQVGPYLISLPLLADCGQR